MKSFFPVIAFCSVVFSGCLDINFQALNFGSNDQVPTKNYDARARDVEANLDAALDTGDIASNKQGVSETKAVEPAPKLTLEHTEEVQ